MLKLAASKGIYLDTALADKLCRLPNPDAIRLYLYASLHETNDEQTARALGLSKEAFEQAEQTLIAAQLAVSASETESIRRKQQMQTAPTYSTAEVSELVTSDMAFAQVVHEAEKVLHPCLSESDLKELMTIYRYFGMPAECIILLLHFAAARTTRQTGRRLSLSTVKREALRWMENDIMTPEAAERFVRRETQIMDTVERMEKVIGLQNYSTEEKRLFRTWAEMGFNDQVVALAKEITLQRIGELQLKYTGSILKSWKDAHLNGLDAIHAYESQREKEYEQARMAAEKRRARKQSTSAPSASGSFSSAERTALQEIQAYIQQNGGQGV